MNRHIWESLIGFLPLKNYPSLPCPYCMEQSLSIDVKSIQHRKAIHPEKTPFLAKEIGNKKQEIADAFKDKTFLGVLAGFSIAFTDAQKSPAKFVCFFKCNNCKGEVSATGTSQIPVSPNNQLAIDVPAIKVEYFSPPIPFFPIHSDVPASVCKEVLQSFNHFHSDPFSSGAKLRRSIEKLCKELGFKGKSLHYAISEMEKEYPQEAQLLHSLKLIGNEAAHADTVSEEDLLNAFEVQEFVLGIFERDKAKKQAAETAAKLVKKFKKTVQT